MNIKNLVSFGVILGTFAPIATFATEENVVTTKTYVDTMVNAKQDKLSGTSGYAVTYGATDGATGSKAIVRILGTDTSAETLPTTGAVVKELNAKQDTFDGTPNTVVTYTSTAGTVGETAVYDETSAYSGQEDSLAEVQHVNSAITNAFNAHITCNEYVSGAAQTPENCLLWDVNDLSGTYIPQSNN